MQVETKNCLCGGKMKIKKIIYTILLVLIISIFIIAILKPVNTKKKNNDKISVVCTSFVGYDFVRAITKGTDNIEITYLLDQGVDSHSFEPTASQLILIQESDLFIYNGGEMENWTEQVIPTLDVSETKLLRIMDTVNLLEEEHVDGAEEEEHHHHELAWDEHVWTSPENAMKIVKAIETELAKVDIENMSIFKENAENYIKEIEKLDNDIWEIVKNAKRKRLVFGDRMPVRYLLEEFNLEASGAFNGCSTETEPSTKTMTYLIDLVKEEKIPVVLYIENGNSKVANIIAQESGAKVKQIQTLHTISSEDYNNGETYVTLMYRNLEVLKQALQ